jgi:hypothetical protein
MALLRRDSEVDFDDAELTLPARLVVEYVTEGCRGLLA